MKSNSIWKNLARTGFALISALGTLYSVAAGIHNPSGDSLWVGSVSSDPSSVSEPLGPIKLKPKSKKPVRSLPYAKSKSGENFQLPLEREPASAPNRSKVHWMGVCRNHLGQDQYSYNETGNPNNPGYSKCLDGTYPGQSTSHSPHGQGRGGGMAIIF